MEILDKAETVSPKMDFTKKFKNKYAKVQIKIIEGFCFQFLQITGCIRLLFKKRNSKAYNKLN